MQKTIKDVEKLLKPLFKNGKPTIISSKDYVWVHKVLSPDDRKAEIHWNGQPVWFDTLKVKIKSTKFPCRWCGKTTGVIKFFIIADDMEQPKPYHPACLDKMLMEAQLRIAKLK